ncbi:MAG: glycine oxidase ThiO [Sideroxydans sp.]|nr:glycine oxidase ThiO [Sideroxydans sp.]
MSTKIIIVGAGAVGLTSALRLLAAGYRVTLLERGAVGQEASWAGGGILAPLCSWDYAEPVTRLAHRGMAMFGDAAHALQQHTSIDPEYQRSGMLVLPPFDFERAKNWCAQHAFAAQAVSSQDYLPAHTPLENPRALLLPNVAQVRNPRLLQALRCQVERLGGEILEHCEVQNLLQQGEQISALKTSRGEMSADGYVITAGAWSKKLLGEYALQLEVKPIRGQILLLKFDAPPLQNIVLQQDLYLIPRRDGHVLIGSTLEDVGFDKSTTQTARDSLLRRTRELFPAWKNVEPIQHWAGFRPASPDNIPTISRHPQLKNLYANTGHFRYGVTMSFASAELLQNEIEARPQPIAVDAYRWT